GTYESAMAHHPCDCVICGSRARQGEPAVSPCGMHLYCKVCITRCLQGRSECPQCKGDVSLWIMHPALRDDALAHEFQCFSCSTVPAQQPAVALRMVSDAAATAQATLQCMDCALSPLPPSLEFLPSASSVLPLPGPVAIPADVENHYIVNDFIDYCGDYDANNNFVNKVIGDCNDDDDANHFVNEIMGEDDYDHAAYIDQSGFHTGTDHVINDVINEDDVADALATDTSHHYGEHGLSSNNHREASTFVNNTSNEMTDSIDKNVDADDNAPLIGENDDFGSINYHHGSPRLANTNVDDIIDLDDIKLDNDSDEMNVELGGIFWYYKSNFDYELREFIRMNILKTSIIGHDMDDGNGAINIGEDGVIHNDRSTSAKDTIIIDLTDNDEENVEQGDNGNHATISAHSNIHFEITNVDDDNDVSNKGEDGELGDINNFRSTSDKNRIDMGVNKDMEEEAIDISEDDEHGIINKDVDEDATDISEDGENGVFNKVYANIDEEAIDRLPPIRTDPLPASSSSRSSSSTSNDDYIST
ncbi:hypothetical protein GOP47_0026159, partial [Adiantum capillus-veneris]